MDHEQSPVETITNEFIQQVRERPPRIAVIGVTGVGKSSTINALFGAGLPISHTKACSTEFRDVPVEIKIGSKSSNPVWAPIVFIDAPGLGESLSRDDEYLDRYYVNLPSCDAAIWIMAARQRAMSIDQTYLEKLKGFSHKMIFAVNQVDLVEPRNFNYDFGVPSKSQNESIEEIIIDRRDKIFEIIGEKREIIPYSADAEYNLVRLFRRAIDACPAERRGIIAAMGAIEEPSLGELSRKIIRGISRTVTRRGE